MVGTASRVDAWFLLEYPGYWAPHPLEYSELDTSIKDYLSELLYTIPRSRLLFIKQSTKPTRTIAFYVATTAMVRSSLYEFRLDSYLDLLKIDINGILYGLSKYDNHVVNSNLFLVCTHGVHDKCCAKFGFPLYQSIKDRRDIIVWQSSHVGGDRFAANLVCLPHGIYYGRVEKGDLETIIDTHNKNDIYLEKFRGRCCYGFVIQAAEHFLRMETREMALDEFRYVRSDNININQWRVIFLAKDDVTRHSVVVAKTAMNINHYVTCGNDKTSDFYQFRLLAYNVV